MKDDLGDRIKSNYEDKYRIYLPKKTYVIARIDGKAFHSYAKDCEKPFDAGLIEDMNTTALALCKQVSGAQLAYVQSDEISLLLTDFAKENTSPWFDNNLQKLASVSASVATVEFNKHRLLRSGVNPTEYRWANFDARFFAIDDPVEVKNYFVWREVDAMRNSVSMIARSYFSHKELENKNVAEMRQMLEAQGINWLDFNMGLRNGRVVVKRQTTSDVVFFNKKTQKEEFISGVTRNEWSVEDAPVFSKSDFLEQFIPQKANFEKLD